MARPAVSEAASAMPPTPERSRARARIIAAFGAAVCLIVCLLLSGSYKLHTANLEADRVDLSQISGSTSALMASISHLTGFASSVKSKNASSRLKAQIPITDSHSKQAAGALLSQLSKIPRMKMPSETQILAQEQSAATLTAEAKELARKAAKLKGLAQAEAQQEEKLRALSRKESALIKEKSAKVLKLQAAVQDSAAVHSATKLKTKTAAATVTSKAAAEAAEVKHTQHTNTHGHTHTNGKMVHKVGPHAEQDVSAMQAAAVKREATAKTKWREAALVMAVKRKSPLVKMAQQKSPLMKMARNPTKSVLPRLLLPTESRAMKLKQEAFKKEFYQQKLKQEISRNEVHQQKLQQIVRNANGDVDFPGEHFPPNHVLAAGGNGTNSTNATDTGDDDDDYDQDRKKDSIWDQLLRIPLTEHVVRTIAYHTPDQMVPILPTATKAAVEKPHKVRIFDDDKDLDDSAELAVPSETPPPITERDPDYYPGGDFVDDTRNATAEEEGFQGGFDDTLVTIPPPVSASINPVGEHNFADFADDDNVDASENATNVHPRAHLGEEFDAAGNLADVLRSPSTQVDPMEKDRFVQVLDTVIENAKPQKESPLDFGDSDVPIETASLPEDAAELKDLGLPASESPVLDPTAAEHDYKFGLMSSFQDRNVDVQPVLDGAVRLAAKWARNEEDLADKMFIEGVDTATEPLVDLDEMEGGAEGAEEEDEEEAAE